MVCNFVKMLRVEIELYSYNGGLIESHNGLSNRAIFNDLDGPQTQISRSGAGHSLTLNISKIAADTAIVTMEGE